MSGRDRGHWAEPPGAADDAAVQRLFDATAPAATDVAVARMAARAAEIPQRHPARAGWRAVLRATAAVGGAALLVAVGLVVVAEVAPDEGGAGPTPMLVMADATGGAAGVAVGVWGELDLLDDGDLLAWGDDDDVAAVDVLHGLGSEVEAEVMLAALDEVIAARPEDLF